MFHIYIYCYIYRFVTANGPSEPVIILGLSGKPEKLINISKCLNLENNDSDSSGGDKAIKVVRRFTGGGTVNK